jgi:hypothetical protein
LLEDIVAGVRDFEPELVFSVIDGADYIPYALVENPEPFDFFLPNAPELPFNPSAQIIPYDLVRSIFEPGLDQAFSLLRRVRDLTGVQIYHFCPPPPVGNESHIRAYPGEMLSEKLEKFGVASSVLRYKLWVLFVDAAKAACERNNATFIGVPASSVDKEGFMREELCALDPVHGNAAYGELVILQMISLAAPSIRH